MDTILIPRRASRAFYPLRYDNVTAGVFDCEQTLDADNVDDFAIEDDSGWYNSRADLAPRRASRAA